MSALRDFIQRWPDLWLAIGGLTIGTVFGAIVYATHFCAMGSISDMLSFGDTRRFRAWILAAATALVGTQLLAATGVVPLEKSMYLSPQLNWFGHIAGGLMFGYGMVFAGGCASRNLSRAGGGDLRAAFTLMVMALFAYMANGGLLGPIRSGIEQATSLDLKRWTLATQSCGDIVSGALQLSASTGAALVTAALVGGAAFYCFRDAKFRASRMHIFSGLGVGLCIIAGWALTGLAVDDLAARPLAPASLTFVRPTADAIEWLERFTAGMMPGFGVATVFGALLGACLVSLSMGRFRLATFANVADTKRHLFGASLMGIGGVMALGCTVGQAITGVSTLAIGSLLTFAAIVAGGVAGVRALERSVMAEA